MQKKKAEQTFISSSTDRRVIYLTERKCWRGTGIPEEERVDYGESKAWSENLWAGWKMVIEPGMEVSRCNKCGNIWNGSLHSVSLYVGIMGLGLLWGLGLIFFFFALAWISRLDSKWKVD